MKTAAFSALWLFVFTIPWESSVVVGGIGTLSRLVGAVAFAVGVLVLLTQGRVRQFATPLLFMTAYFAILLAGVFWTIDPEAINQQILTGIQLLFMVHLIWHQCTTERHVRSLQLAYVLGAYVSVVATVLVFANGAGTTDNRYMAPGFNPNELGIMLAIGIPMAWELGATSKRLAAVWVYRAYIPAALLAVFLTASRGGLLAAIAATTVVPLSYRSLSLRQKIGLALVLATSLYQIGQIVPAENWQRLLTIPQQLDGGDLNYRTVIWSAGLDIFGDHPWLGIGPGAFPRAVRRVLGGEFVAHNTFISVLVQQGILGFGLFLGILFSLVGGLWAVPKHRRHIQIVLLTTWLIGAFSTTWEQKKVTWFVFTLLLMSGSFAHRRRRSSSSWESKPTYCLLGEDRHTARSVPGA